MVLAPEIRTFLKWVTKVDASANKSMFGIVKQKKADFFIKSLKKTILARSPDLILIEIGS